MIDLNTAELQTESVSAIPEDSIVPFKMTIRPPKDSNKQGSQHPLFCRSQKGNEYIDVEFEAQGAFAGKKVWQNFTLAGSDMAAKISMRTLRAIVESARGIAPSDSSPQATAGRKLSDFADFNGMVFLAKVKCVVEQSDKNGNWYVNNEFKKIITPDDEEYARGEFISGKPLPELPLAGTLSKTATPTTSGAWGAPPAAQAAVAATPAMVPPTNPVNNTPSWAMR